MTDTQTQEPPPERAGATPVRRLVLAALMCLAIGALGGLFAATFTDPKPAPARFVPPRERAYDFRLRDQDGRPASLADERGKVLVMTWIYTSCRDLCPAEGSVIADAVKRVAAPGVAAYAVSVDTVGDTPARARDWIRFRHWDGYGRYLLGTRAQLRPVWEHYGIAPIDATPAEARAAAAGADQYRATNAPPPVGVTFYQRPPKRPPPPASEEQYPDTQDLKYRGRARHVAGLDFEHSAYVLLIDRRGVQRVGIPFEQLDAASLARDIRVLLAER